MKKKELRPKSFIWFYPFIIPAPPRSSPEVALQFTYIFLSPVATNTHTCLAVTTGMERSRRTSPTVLRRMSRAAFWMEKWSALTPCEKLSVSLANIHVTIFIYIHNSYENNN